MQYGIMLIAKYFNQFFKFHSLCGAGEYCEYCFNLLLFKV